MATDSDLDSWEFRMKAEATRQLHNKNGFILPFASVEKSSFCGTNQSAVDLQTPDKVHENDYDHISKSSKSGSEFRFINPAIYAESFETDEYCGDRLEKSVIRGQIHSHRCDNLSTESQASKCEVDTLADGISILSISNNDASSSTINLDGDHAPGTYRCLASDTSLTTASSQNSCNQQFRTTKRIERRCKISNNFKPSSESRSTEDLCFISTQRDERKCLINGHGNMLGSNTSLSTINLLERQTLSGVPITRLIAHAHWEREKEKEALKIKEEKRQAEQKKREKVEKMEREREERERRERECFQRWAERKKREEAARREAVERELELQRRFKEVEDKAAIAKTIYLRQWARKKEEEQKTQQRKQELKRQLEEEEKKKRLEDSVKAYEKWREKSKDKPKPATQGLLPHQKGKPAYVNPQPWQQIVESTGKFEEISKVPLEEPSKELFKDSNENRKTLKLGNSKNKTKKTRSAQQ